MKNPELGQVIEDHAWRDAIHVAVAPVIAVTLLHPGQHIGLVQAGNEMKVGPVKHPIGIVDPFLTAPVPAGKKFWMLLYPQTITNLRHDWIHPAFTAAAVARQLLPLPSESEAWLRELAFDCGMPYEKLLEAATRYLDHDEIYPIGFDTPEKAYDPKTFWKHYEQVTGRMADKDAGTIFRCAC